jgi:hypothetical protein
MDRQHMLALDSQMAGSGNYQIYLPVDHPRISHASLREQKKDWEVYGNLSKRTAAHSKRKNRVVNRRSKIPNKINWIVLDYIRAVPLFVSLWRANL